MSINGGIDIIKVGIGSGAVCTNLITNRCWYAPPFVVMSTDAAHGLDSMIISDGGICHPGDVGKAFGGGGADFVMIEVCYRHSECPGELIEEEGKKYKLFYGMSSDTENKYHGGVASYRLTEGKP